VFEIEIQIEKFKGGLPYWHPSTVDAHGEAVQNSTDCHRFEAGNISVPDEEKKEHCKRYRNEYLFPWKKLKHERNGK